MNREERAVVDNHRPTLNYYHYTTKKNWEEIKTAGGLVPYDCTHPDNPFQKDVKGIWMWKDVNNELLRDFFLWKCFYNGDFGGGYLLFCHHLSPELMLTEKLRKEFYKPFHFSHNLKISGIRGTESNSESEVKENQRHKAAFDIYTEFVPMANIKCIKSIGIELVDYDAITCK